MYLSKMEAAGHFLSLIRPRRFGKSLFLSMMNSWSHLYSEARNGKRGRPAELKTEPACQPLKQ